MEMEHTPGGAKAEAKASKRRAKSLEERRPPSTRRVPEIDLVRRALDVPDADRVTRWLQSPLGVLRGRTPYSLLGSEREGKKWTRCSVALSTAFTDGCVPAGQPEYAPANSEGAWLYGGRWNQAGTRVIYTSATRSLAAIEVIAHYGAIPHDYQVIVIEIPDDLTIEAIELSGLPENWAAPEHEGETAKLGTEWASSLRTAVLRVPSAAILGEYNTC